MGIHIEEPYKLAAGIVVKGSPGNSKRIWSKKSTLLRWNDGLRGVSLGLTLGAFAFRRRRTV